MKKLTAYIFLSIISTLLFAQKVPSNAKVTVATPIAQNLSISDSSWLPSTIREKLESNLQSVTSFTFIAFDTKKIRAEQKKSISAGYDENNSLELGKMTSAKYAVFSKLQKINSSYILTANLTDLTTAVVLANVTSSQRTTPESLCITEGCAANEVTVKLCEQLGINLSASQKYSFLHGEQNLSNDEQLEMLKQEEKDFSDAIAKMNEQIKKLSVSTDQNSVAQKAKIEAEKVLAQEKLRASKEKAKRLEEEAQKFAEDKAADAARSEEQKKRRDLMAKQASEKAAQLRKLTFESESIFTKINVIESKKKAILDIQKSVDSIIAEIKKDGENEFAKKKKEIIDAPYRVAEKNLDGTPSNTAKNRREKQIKDLKQEIDSRIEKEIEEVSKSAVENVITLYSEIKKDENNLSRGNIVSSFESDLKVQISNFDGKTNAWKITFWLYSNGIPVTNKSVNMTYKNLTGKEIDISSDITYNDFLDTVDLYNSLFSRREPILIFTLIYEIKPVDDYSSKYKITLWGIDVKDTISGNLKCTLKFEQPELIRQMKPTYDLRCGLIRLAKNQIDLLPNFASRFAFRQYCEDNKNILKLSSQYSNPPSGKVYQYIKEISIPYSLTEINEELFSGCERLESVTIPNSVTIIGNRSFDGCKYLKDITIPDSVTKIGSGAFKGCSLLKSITIPDSVTAIESNAFDGCIMLENITIPDGVTKIGNGAFKGCSMLKTLTIPDSVTRIESEAFLGCRLLKNVTITAKISPSFNGYDKNIFSEHLPSDFTIYVPAESLENYNQSWYWKKYANYIKAIKE